VLITEEASRTHCYGPGKSVGRRLVQKRSARVLVETLQAGKLSGRCSEVVGILFLGKKKHEGKTEWKQTNPAKTANAHNFRRNAH